MVVAYKEHFQFIMILVFMYVMGVWVDPTIYIIFPVVLLMLGLKGRYFELLVCALWMLILSDYIPVEGATYADLQFAKDLKPLIPITLFGFVLMDLDGFRPFPKFLVYFIPFFVIVIIGLSYASINFQVGFQKTVSFILMYTVVPVYVARLSREQGQFFWISIFTFVIGMLTIGVALGFAIPQIGILENTTRFKGIFGNPNGVGIFLNLTFILWFVLEEFGYLNLTKRERLYVLAILLISVFWSGSRNGMMSILLFYLTFRAIKINWFVGIIVVVSFVSFNEFITVLLVEVVAFFGMEDFFRIDTLEEGSGRIVGWAFAWEQIQHYFFVGGGFGHDEHVMRPNYSWLQLKGHDGGVHNSYLSMWFDSGILGVIAYFTAFIKVLVDGFRVNTIALAVAVSVLFNITYESWLVASLNPFTIMLLFILTIFVTKNSVVVSPEKVHEEMKVGYA